MKKLLYLLPALILSFCFLLVGCDKGDISVKIYLNNGTETITKRLSKGEELSLPEDVVSLKDYLEFDNWYLNSSFTNEYDPSEKMEKDINIYAKWKLKENYHSSQKNTPSMSASGINKNDYVVVKQVNLSTIQNETIIAYYNCNLKQNNASNKESMYTVKQNNTNDFKTGEKVFESNIYLHQVIGIYYDSEGHTWYETKGTSNAVADATLVRGDYVIAQFVEVFNEYPTIVKF